MGLRVRQVRHVLCSNEDVMKSIGFIAEGADAIRHLTPALVTQTLHELECLLRSAPVPACTTAPCATPLASSRASTSSVASPRFVPPSEDASISSPPATQSSS